MSMGGFAGDALRQQVIIDVQAGDGGLIDALEQKLRNLKATADTTTEMWREGSISADMYAKMIGQTGKAIDQTINQLNALKGAQQANAQSITDQARAMWAAQRSFDAVNEALQLMAQHEATAAVATDHMTSKVQGLTTSQQGNTGSNDQASQGMIHLTRTMYFASQAADDFQYSFCLRRGSLIRMAGDGEVPIEDVRPGDVVVSLLATGRLGEQVVRAAVFSGIKAIRRLSVLTGQCVECSGNHPLLTLDGWREAEKLLVGDSVAIPEGDGIRWTPIGTIEHLGDYPTHDLQLIGEPNFIAGGIIVHNSAIVNNLPLIAMEGTRAAGSFGWIKGTNQDLNMLGMQMGALVAIIGVGINTVVIPAIKNWVAMNPEVKAFFAELNKGLNPFYVEQFSGSVDKLKERIKELESQKVRLAVDDAELDTAKEKLEKLIEAKRSFDAIMSGHSEEEVKAGEYLKKDLATKEGRQAVDEIRRRQLAQLVQTSPELRQTQTELVKAEEAIHEFEVNTPKGHPLIIEAQRNRLREDVEAAREKLRKTHGALEKSAVTETGLMTAAAFKGDTNAQERLIAEIQKNEQATVDASRQKLIAQGASPEYAAAKVPGLAERLERDRANAMADMDRQEDQERKGVGLAHQIHHEATKKSIQVEKDAITKSAQETTAAAEALSAQIKAQAQMFAKDEGGARALRPDFTVESVKRDLEAAGNAAMKQEATRIHEMAIKLAKLKVEEHAIGMGPGTTQAAALADLEDAEKRRAESVQKRTDHPGRELAQKYQQTVSEEMLRLTYESMAAGKSEEFIKSRMAAELQRRMERAGEEAGVAQQGAGLLAGDLLQKARAGVAGIGDRPARQAAAYLAQEAQIKARRTFEAEGARHVQDVGIGIGALPTAEQRQLGQVRGGIAKAGQNFATQNLAQQFAGATNATDAQALTMAKRSMQMMQRGVSFNEATTVAYQEMMRQLYQLEFRQMRTERQMLQTRRARNGNNLNSR